MKQLSNRLLQMIEDRLQLQPEAMVKVDIEPPFVGADFEATGADPSFSYVGGVLYLSLIDNGKIKVLTVDPVEMKVTGMLREIEAPNARRPRLTFEPSPYAGKPDLPHVGYTDPVAGKAMVYREQYDAQGLIVKSWDDIGNGSDCESIRMGQTMIDFYVGTDGILYSRLQGEFAEAFVDYTSEGAVIKSARVIALPDDRFGVVLVVTRADGVDEARMLYSSLYGSKDFDGDTFSASISTHEIIMKQTSFPFEEDSFDATISMNKLELIANLLILEETIEPRITVSLLKLPGPITPGDETLSPQLRTNHIRMDPPKWAEENLVATISIQTVALT